MASKDAESTSAEQWVRLPHPRGGRLCGLARTTILELIQDEVIQSATIKKKGARRGIRLIFLPSLLQHLNRLAKQQSAK